MVTESIRKLRGMRHALSFRAVFKDNWIGAEHYASIADAVKNLQGCGFDAVIFPEWPHFQPVAAFYGDNVRE